MQFITTDQRIAVENFEVGVVYTVAFTSGDSFTGSCMGIGVDFVAFQRTAPEYIFCLTMTTAADVASIEPISDDIGKILTYTGSVPVSIKTDDTPLLDYIISGNTVQSGTPTPDNPIMPQGCGDLETVGIKAGQYKIPISSANTTTPVYLGEVQATRKIRKLVLDGTENILLYSVSTGNLFRISLPVDRIQDNFYGNGVCSHYKTVLNTTERVNGTISGAKTASLQGFVDIVDDYSTIADFKAYLAAQYAAGTPVTIWYVLAEPETGVVNEPLMRIGDYADTLSKEQADATIPTNNGSTTVDVDTTVKPSEVYLKYFSPLF